jgi:predicted glycosyltransferase
VKDDGRIAVHQFMNRAQQQEMMNRARLIVSRSGYTTMMELAEVGKRALLVPTRGQSEQEYLAAHHERCGHFRGVIQSQLVLARDAALAQDYRGLPPFAPTRESVRNFLNAVCG